MLMKKPVGRNGATRKYDLLTVLGAYALGSGKTMQRQSLRLICLITARYNWQGDELSVGQAEIARLWAVDLRTVKREMAALRERGWLIEKRAAARGRVTLYGLGIARILDDTRGAWERVGPDLVARLDEGAANATAPQQIAGQVIPFPVSSMQAADTPWGRVREVLAAEHPALFGAWFSQLEEIAGEAGFITLRAPSAFLASYVTTRLSAQLAAAAQRVDPSLIAVRVI